MDKLINLMQSVNQDYRAFAWLILGVLLPVLIVVGLITLYWVSNGGLRDKTTDPPMVVSACQVQPFLSCKSFRCLR